MVKRTTRYGTEYWEPPYSDEELAVVEKSIYGDIRTVARTYPPSGPRPTDPPPASKQTGRRPARKPPGPSS